MKVRFNKTTWRAASGIVASFLLVVSFQNCGKAGFDAELDSNLDLGSGAALTAKYGQSSAAKIADIPFAFEADFDTITYNSCAEAHLKNNDAYFSLKMGAYSTGGIKLSTDFFSYVDQNFSPIYPETSLSQVQYKEFLMDSPANAGVTPTVAVRKKDSLTDVYIKGSSLTVGTDVIPLVGEMTDPLVMDSVISKNVTASYFPFSPEQKVMEGALTFNDSESLAESFRQLFHTSATLALTFLPKNVENYKVSSASTAYPVKKAYGTGYRLTFSQMALAGQPSTNPNPSRVLNEVYEMDLANPTTSGRTWNCGRVYKVVRAEDAATYCPAHTQAQLNDTYIRSELEIARRHLRADQWDVNVNARCVVPKKVSCYKEENLNGFPLVQYDLTKECFRPNVTNPAATSRCMHFVTICTR